MAILVKPNSLSFLLLLLLLFSLSTAAQPPASPPQCKTTNVVDVGPTEEKINDPTFSEPSGLGPGQDPEVTEKDLDTSPIVVDFSDQTGPFVYTPGLPPPPAQSPKYPSNPHPDDDAQTICSHTDHPDFCLTTFHTALMESEVPVVDSGAVVTLRMLIRALRKATWLAHEKAGIMAITEDVDAKAAAGNKCLEVCRSGYKQAMEDLDVALEALEKDERGRLGTFLSGLFWEYSSCGNEFAQKKVNTVMEMEEAVLMELASVCMSIAAKYFNP